MAEAAPQEDSEQRLDAMSRFLDSGTMQQALRMMNALHPAEIGDLLESLPPKQRMLLWELVDKDIRGNVLLEVGDEVREDLLREMDVDDIRVAAAGLDTDDLADFLQSLPGKLLHEALQGMDKQNRHRLEQVLSYPEDSAGGLMDLDTVTVRPDVSLDVVMRYLRLRGQLPDNTDWLIVVDRYDLYLGVLSLRRLLTSDPELTVAEVMRYDVEGIPADLDDEEVARLFEDRDLISAPVIDDDGRLLGRITIDDVVDVIRERADHSMLSMAGLDEDHDIFSPVLRSLRGRAIWLGINLMTAFLASWVIGQFEGTLEKIVALAILMPIVASMGGIAGSQTLTLVIRGQALGQVGRTNIRWLLNKEMAVSALNGVIWALVVGVIAYLWFADYRIGLVIAAAIAINLVTAAFAGVAIPLILRQLDIDPALAGGVILTTVTDVVGFLSFLGLATLFILA